MSTSACSALATAARVSSSKPLMILFSWSVSDLRDFIFFLMASMMMRGELCPRCNPGGRLGQTDLWVGRGDKTSALFFIRSKYWPIKNVGKYHAGRQIASQIAFNCLRVNWENMYEMNFKNIIFKHPLLNWLEQSRQLSASFTEPDPDIIRSSIPRPRSRTWHWAVSVLPGHSRWSSGHPHISLTLVLNQNLEPACHNECTIYCV